MATVITNLGNRNLGVKNISAGDWVRLKKLHATRRFIQEQVGNKDILGAMTNTTSYPPPFHSPFRSGSSRIRRTASGYTDYVAAQAADYVLQGGGVTTVNAVCDCARVSYTFGGTLFNVRIDLGIITTNTIEQIRAFIAAQLGVLPSQITDLSIGY